MIETELSLKREQTVNNTRPANEDSSTNPLLPSPGRNLRQKSQSKLAQTTRPGPLPPKISESELITQVSGPSSLGPTFAPRPKAFFHTRPRGSRNRHVWDRVTSTGQLASIPSTQFDNMSFWDIQRQQKLEQHLPAHKVKVSLLEIQEQEAAQQQEEEFLRWWAAEEERVRNEQGALNAMGHGVEGSGRRKDRGKAAKKGKREGRGKSRSKVIEGGEYG